MQLDKLKKLAVAFSLCASTSAFSAEHNESILNACPSLKPGAVETAEIPYGLDLSTNNWGHITSLSGTIDAHSTAALRDAILFVPDATADKEDIGDLLIMVNSPGGDLEQAETITTAMDMSPHSYITTVCASQASSSALAVLAAGHQRLAFPNCHSIVHATSYNMSNVSRKDALAHFESVARLDAYYESVLTKNGKNPQMDNNCHESLESNGEIRLSAMDLLRLGLVDGVLSPDNTSQTVLTSNPQYQFYKCVEAGKNDLSEDQIEEQYETLRNQCLEHLGF